jgi:N-acetylglutamate synthase-like GNAT family acetyltransferase
MTVRPVTPSDLDQVRTFLTGADLTVAGLDSDTLRLWVEHGADGAIVGTTGFELSADGRHALVRSVAVHGSARSNGAGTRLGRCALDGATRAGAERAWLFSRRSGPFWQRLGFEAADRNELTSVLPDAHQVRLFTETGQLEREVAWSRALP